LQQIAWHQIIDIEEENHHIRRHSDPLFGDSRPMHMVVVTLTEKRNREYRKPKYDKHKQFDNLTI
jgi:hypothetical protein